MIGTLNSPATARIVRSTKLRSFWTSSGRRNKDVDPSHLLRSIKVICAIILERINPFYFFSSESTRLNRTERLPNLPRRRSRRFPVLAHKYPGKVFSRAKKFAIEKIYRMRRAYCFLLTTLIFVLGCAQNQEKPLDSRANIRIASNRPQEIMISARKLMTIL